MFKFTIFTLLAAALAIANPLPTPFEAYENHEELENRATIYTRPTEKAHHFVWIDPNPSRARITVYTQSKWTNTPSKATGFYWAVSASGNFDHGFKVDIPGSDKFSCALRGKKTSPTWVPPVFDLKSAAFMREIAKGGQAPIGEGVKVECRKL